MGKMLTGVLVMATLVSAGLYDRMGPKESSATLSAPARQAPLAAPGDLPNGDTRVIEANAATIGASAHFGLPPMHKAGGTPAKISPPVPST